MSAKNNVLNSVQEVTETGNGSTDRIRFLAFASIRSGSGSGASPAAPATTTSVPLTPPAANFAESESSSGAVFTGPPLPCSTQLPRNFPECCRLSRSAEDLNAYRTRRSEIPRTDLFSLHRDIPIRCILPGRPILRKNVNSCFEDLKSGRMKFYLKASSPSRERFEEAKRRAVCTATGSLSESARRRSVRHESAPKSHRRIEHLFGVSSTVPVLNGTDYVYCS